MFSRQALLYVRLFIIFVFACVLFQAARTTYVFLTGHEIVHPAKSTKFYQLRHSLALNKLKRVDSDPEMERLEKYIFQRKKWKFPISPKPKRDSDTWRRTAKITKVNDLKLLPTVKTGRINCQRFIANETDYMTVARDYMKVYPRIAAKNLAIETANCQNFAKERGYVTSSMTSEEREYSLAYSLLVYKDAEMLERILRMIYRPQNYYCIHVDSKAEKSFHEEIVSLTKCFKNVFIASRRVDVNWGTLSLLLADLVCMRDLLSYKWRYYINLTGQEFPLRNNYELVQVFKSLRGSNDVESTFKYKNTERYLTLHDIDGRPSNLQMPKPPLNITIVKGNMHGSFSRGFVDFLLNDGRSKTVFDWVKHTGMPEETFFATMNANPHLGAPGAYTGGTFERPRLLSREIRWYTNCGGKIVRGVCVNGLADLKRLTESRKLFLNKFHLDFEYLALDCYEQWFFDRSREIYSGKSDVNLKPYMQWIKDPALRKMAS